VLNVSTQRYIAGYITRHFRNKRLRAVSIRAGRYKTHGPPPGYTRFTRALPTRLLEVFKKGKVLFFMFEDNWFLIVRMGMVGWFSRPGDDTLHAASPNIVFQFENGPLHYADFRNFGTLTFTQNPVEVMHQVRSLAPDVLDPHATPNAFFRHIQTTDLVATKPHMTLETLLMDQTLLLSGIGNIIKSETLYDARLSPNRTVRSLSHDDWRRLFASARRVSRRVLANLTSKRSDWDSYMDLHVDYQRDVDPKGHPVQKQIAADGRATFWVPAVQH
jgi:formamidopyrimidine-DNA glycosylase